MVHVLFSGILSAFPPMSSLLIVSSEISSHLAIFYDGISFLPFYDDFHVAFFAISAKERGRGRGREWGWGWGQS